MNNWLWLVWMIKDILLNTLINLFIRLLKNHYILSIYYIICLVSLLILSLSLLRCLCLILNLISLNILISIENRLIRYSIYMLFLYVCLYLNHLLRINMFLFFLFNNLIFSNISIDYRLIIYDCFFHLFILNNKVK